MQLPCYNPPTYFTNIIIMKRTSLHKHIYKVKNSYVIVKSLNNKRKSFGSFKNLNDAIEHRDKLKANGWKPLPKTEEELSKEYYKHIQRTGNKRQYHIHNKKDEYIGTTVQIEEALMFRDLYLNTPKNECPPIKSVDLKTNNPYYDNGLKYPLPERLVLVKRTSGYGTGTIVVKGETSFHVHHGKKGNGFHSYVCACPTWEMAEYVRMEMNKVNWDKSKLPGIIDGYPKYYSYLLRFYNYIHTHDNGYNVAVPKTHSSNGALEIYRYRKLEDALYERDFLVENNWDYDLLVETLDDNLNPYYDMTLPPFPTRRIRNVSERNYHEEELTAVMEMIREGKDQIEICETLNILSVTLRNWLKNGWGSSFNEFKKLTLAGENPLEVLEKQELIYQPDLSRAKPNNFNGNVHRMKRGSYQVMRKGEYYGAYPNEKLARKIVKELKKVDWDKSKLKQIHEKIGYTSPVMSKRWVYKGGRKWYVRRKDKNRHMVTYGGWHDKRIACIVRDLLIKYGWKVENMQWIEEIAVWTVQMMDLLPYAMFGQVTLEDIAYFESECETPYCIPARTPGKYIVTKWSNGHAIHYGTYSESKAKEVIEFLEDNNWDKDLLKIMQEMGGI